MAAAKRKSPTSSNGDLALPTTPTAYAARVNDEVAALWRYMVCPLISIGGSANAITAATDTAAVSVITAYQAGMKFTLTPGADNTGAVTLAIDGLAAMPVKDAGGAALLAGMIESGRRILVEYDGAAFRVLGGVGDSSIDLSPTAPAMILQDQKAQGTHGGSFASGAWQTRTLNTAVRNVIAGASLAANQFTLPAGVYFIKWRAPAENVQQHQTRLQNITDGTTVAYGETAFGGSAYYVTNCSEGVALITLTASKTFELQHRCTATFTTYGYGQCANLATEVYSTVEIWEDVYSSLPVPTATGLAWLAMGSKTAHGVLLGNGTAEPGVTAAMTDGQVLVGQTGAAPSPKTVSGDGAMSAAGALTVSSIGGVPVGTSGNTIPKNNTANTFSAAQTFSSDINAPSGIWKSSNGYLGVGNTAPTARITASDNTSAPPAALSGTVIHGVGPDSGAGRFLLDTWGATAGSSPVFALRRARGSNSSPSAVQTNDFLATFGAYGYGATGYTSTARASLQMYAGENWTDSAQGTYLTIETTPNGSTTRAEKLRVHGSGAVSIGETADPGAIALAVNGYIRAKVYTVATLPTGVTGAIAFASNLRVFDAAGAQQGAGAGTGGYVVYNGTAWKNLDAQAVTAAA